MEQISILGCGWLGLPLAKALISEGHSVKGSTTSNDKKELLENAGIAHYPIALEVKNFSAPVADFLENSPILIIAIPPKLRGKNKDYSDAQNNSFVQKIKNLIPYIEKSSVEKLLFISSTAVYGEADTIIDENSPTVPVTESGKQLLEIEQLLLANTNFKTTILRFGGLIGPDRNPSRFLAGKENVPNPDAPVNLIHLDDCIGIIKKIIANTVWNEVLNAVTPFHPSRKDYYTQKALEENLIPPTFNHEIPSAGKTIVSEKLARLLDYTFTQPNL
ncbi:Nucleoside-diphosphate-sugar epimerase [Flavobacterium glycines]|uniref:Epimerase n=1 Tax=Flavobacterium glycines TaxID=551990 RepID=A0A1B9DPC5_9FLAO|nr:NAD-dependent epimerase/dehydratase family protein [Flavobacterium glycines]OCB71521.1 NAD(P)-dependent oxidoreductase [Flavobacterium glycines]GEL10550.1 epimerase [Flavobacterium glycines]SDI63596.1 Nucleoside-diphosphate-sugar epimerase [Flavobacterium glycines]